MKSISLLELNKRIKEVVKANFTQTVWVRGEISSFVERNGHAYFEFVEKDKQTDKIVAKSRVTCWASVFGMLRPYFESATGESLRTGLEILVAVSVEFSEQYGVSLNIRDIDPTFTVGSLATRRKEIIRQLEEDGVMGMNKEVPMPAFAKRLAIISSPTAAGYGDFCNQLDNNTYGFKFYTKLFPAIVQGERAEASIISALDKIYKNAECFDVVLLIRGGGATTDLACFDSYELALNCAQFPLPILAGIGHQRDVSVVDLVVHKSLKTPTAVAEYLLDEMYKNLQIVSNLSSELRHLVNAWADNKQHQINVLQSRVRHQVNRRLLQKEYLLQTFHNRLKQDVKLKFQKQHSNLEMLGYKLEANSPQQLLGKGLSLTFVNGKRLYSVQNVKSGDQVRTYLKDGSFESVVE